MTVTPTGADDDSDGDCPSLSQQRADALVTVVTHPGAGTVDAEVVVHVAHDGNFLADGARTFLEYDHKQPYPLGGPTILSNLQRLCGPHNRAKYRAGIAQKDRPREAS